jgi:hypothetical protein
MYIIAQEQTNPDMPERIIAAHDQIGFWDDGDDAETLRFIDLSDINSILMNEGYVMVYADEDGDPILEEGYVTLCAHMDEDDEEWVQTWGENDEIEEPWQE